MSTQRVDVKYKCDMCGKEFDFAGVHGLRIGSEGLEYSTSKSGDRHICIYCWDQIEALQKRLSRDGNAV